MGHSKFNDELEGFERAIKSKAMRYRRDRESNDCNKKQTLWNDIILVLVLVFAPIFLINVVLYLMFNLWN